MIRKNGARLFAVPFILWGSACSTVAPSTRIESVQREASFNPAGFHRALVIGVFPDAQRRKMFEDGFAKQIGRHKIETVPSYRIFPTLEGVDRDQVKAQVRSQGFDLVFISRLVDRKMVDTVVPGPTVEVPPDPLDGAATHFTMASHEVTAPGYAVQQSAAVLETKIFEVQSGTCVWTCRSQTLINGYLDDLIRDFSQAMTQSLFSQPSTKS